MTTILCSVGTSAAKGVCSPGQLPGWVGQVGGPQAAGSLLFDRIKGVAPTGEALRSHLSAEIHSLVRMGVGPKDTALLLCSETDDGEACGLAVGLYLNHYFTGIHCIVEKVPGLQVTDAERFRREGVVNFVAKCLAAVRDYGSGFTILNPTGGFKALVPYTVLVGMLKGVRCQYIFEQSAALLTLPPLPVTIDRAAFERYRLVLEKIERDTAIPQAEWQSRLQRDDQPLLEPLVEICDGQVTLSGVGLLFLDDLRAPSALVPYLSRKAWDDCLDNLAKITACDPFRYIRRIAQNKEIQPQHIHINNHNGTFWMKPGNTTDRYLVSVEGWKLLVWRAVTHAAFGDDYVQRVVVDPRTDRNRHAPFTRLDIAEAD